MWIKTEKNVDKCGSPQKRMWINCGNKKFSEEQLSEAAKILAAGGLVAFPTETVYGLGANALLPEAVAQVYAVKGRPSDNPLIVHLADPEQLKDYVDNLHPAAEKLMAKFWPGP